MQVGNFVDKVSEGDGIEWPMAIAHISTNRLFSAIRRNLVTRTRPPSPGKYDPAEILSPDLQLRQVSNSDVLDDFITKFNLVLGTPLK